VIELFVIIIKISLNFIEWSNENDVVAHLAKIIRFNHFGEEIILPSNQGEMHSVEGYIDNIIDMIGS